MKNRKCLFHERFNKLKEQTGKTQTLIAEELGISKQQMSYYANGREPDYDTLIKIAKLFNVSTDYLLGVTDIQTKDMDTKKICKYTGLSEKSAMILSSIPKKSSLVKTINVIIENYEWITGDNHEK